MTIALITVLAVVAALWLLYRDPPKQRPGEALGKFDRVAQRIHDVVQGRWYGKVLATIIVLAAGLAVSQAFSTDTLTASTRTVTVTTEDRQTVTVTVSTPTDPGTTTETTPAPAPGEDTSVVGTWSGTVVSQSNKAVKFPIRVHVDTTEVDVETVGWVRLNDDRDCIIDITAGNQTADTFMFTTTSAPPGGYHSGCNQISFSLERNADDTVVIETDFITDGVGILKKTTSR